MGREPVAQLFRAGDPVKRDQEAFVPREAVNGPLDQQLCLANGCPGLVLYARRWMGKSTLLENLDLFIPSSVTPRVVSMQDATVFTSLPYFVERVTEGAASDLPGMTAWLNATDQRLTGEKRRLVLALADRPTQAFPRRRGLANPV